MRFNDGRAAKRLAAGLAAMAMLATAACGSNDSGDSADGTPTLKVALLSTGGTTALQYIAEVKGFYEDFGVDVELLDNTGNNTLNLIASGDADLALMASTGPITLKQRGKDATIVAASTGGAAGGYLVGGEGFEEIEDLKGERIATLGKGTSVYGHAALYSERYGLDADLVPMESPAAAAAAVKSGQVAGAVGPYAGFAQLIADGSLNTLIDSRDPEVRAEKIGPDFPEGALFGLTENVDEKRDAVERFLAATDAAYTYMTETDPGTLAQELRTLESFKTIPEDALTGVVKDSLPHMHLNGGVMDEATWDLCLKQFSDWGLSDYSADDPDFAYDEIVDPTFMDEAKKLEQEG